MFSKLLDAAGSLPRVLTGMLRHGVMVPYHEDPGFTTEIIGVHTVYAGSATIA